ncbi:hypothetical protein SAMN04490244_107135 [Tranquillimonas rosea]|uniref:Uncharacterized protein n=1 Tax=Tranquillimonas rosea TaxID=641238 RepID=A0A1H9VHM1_9RHOB|nr:hypothetical protein [Tranquillimonas rosea]SES21276.1 hypothetical protein SAMN04490244_107135 [Tranquillimonas rosea]
MSNYQFQQGKKDAEQGKPVGNLNGMTSQEKESRVAGNNASKK